MEQYEIKPERYWNELQNALNYFQPWEILIRQIGSLGGKIVVRTILYGKQFAVTKSERGLHIIINHRTRIVFKPERHESSRCRGLLKWAFAYERCYPPSPGYPDGHMHHAGTGYPNPDAPELPPVTDTLLRCANETHFIKITFPGKIPIVRTDEPTKDRYWPYWGVKASAQMKKQYVKRATPAKKGT